MAEKKKNRTFSIYLLKDGFDEKNFFKVAAGIKEKPCSKLPTGAKLFIKINKGIEPWWEDYWGLDERLKQSSLGALVFIPHKYNNKQYNFILAFGYAYHAIKPESFVYDFGLIVTLNALDSAKLNSIESFSLVNSKRERLQAPSFQDINFFDLDNDSSILKTLTGKPQDKYSEIIRHITGANNVRITNPLLPDELKELFNSLIILYNEKTYETTFPNINNVKPIKDPIKITELMNTLFNALSQKNSDIELSFPAIIDYQEYAGIKYSTDKNTSDLFENLNISQFYEFCESNKIDYSETQLKKIKINIENSVENYKSCKYNFLNCCLFSTKTNDENYYFVDGQWYFVNSNYVEQLNKYIDKHIIKTDFLKECTYKTEDEYNSFSEDTTQKIYNLDKKNIAPKGNIEPCDLIKIESDKLILIHNKISTRSSLLSHLFSQGFVSVETLLGNTSSQEKLINLLTSKNENIKTLVEKKKFEVIYGILTTKDTTKKSDNLPLFSKITMRRYIQELEERQITANVTYIKYNPTKGALSK